MIDKIQIKEIATYDDEGILIDNLDKVNFIYGANGTGKTTISRIIQNPEDLDFADCSIKWNDDVPIKSLIYNKAFRDLNFGRSSIAGVFTLGQATREEVEAINLKKSNLEILIEKGKQKKRSRDKLIEQKKLHDNDLSAVIWSSIYKRYEENYKEAFIGSINSKEKFKEKTLKEFIENSGEEIADDKLLESAKTIFKGTPQRINNLTAFDFSRLIEIEENGIWAQKVIGKSDVDISKLIARLNINDWVFEGANYIQEEDETCPFCQQKTISNEFRKQIDDFFDEDFLQKTKLVKELSEEYQRIGTNLQNQLTLIETAQKENVNSKLELELYSSQLRTLSNVLIANKEILINKEQEPSRILELVSLKEQSELIGATIGKANEKINTHNQIVDNFQNEKTKLINNIWFKIIEDNRAMLSQGLRKSNGLQTGIENIERLRLETGEEYRILNRQIKVDTRNVTSIQPTIDEINRILAIYGFDNFQIVPSTVENNHYQIERQDGSLATSTLSEGEITFLTFLYFQQLVKGGISEDEITDNKVVIIDDPISSLDSNILFVVSTLIKGLLKKVRAGTGNIKQVILLTHNVYFHKEVSFIDGRTSELENTKYWILRKNNSKTSIQYYETNNPIKTSYDLLWQELNNESNTSSITVQNIMRRIIEHYFKLLGKYGDDVLISKFETGEEQEICRSLISWINEGSHTIPDDLYIEQHDNTKEKYLLIFKRIFEEMNQIEHYNMMMRNVNASG